VNASVRRVVFWFVGAGLLAVLLAGFAGLPTFGRSTGSAGDRLNHVEVRQRSATDVVTAVVLDYRGFDTMAEETILFAAAIGVALLLRPTRGERTIRPPREMPPAIDDVIGFLGRCFVGPVALIGLYVVGHGHLTPGGGFQGGVVIASATMSVWLTLGHRPFERLNPIAAVDLAEGIGIGGFPLIGLVGVAAGATFLSNVLPLGQPGSLLSAGTMPILNVFIGVAVAAGFLLIVSEFLEQTLHGGGDV
jgi:multicomponent Na+:H+ antiporter subunit B